VKPQPRRGEMKLKKGNVVEIFHDPVTKQKSEGKAKLIKCEIKRPDEEYWQVVFLGDEYKTSRWIKT
jgi:hypothetical protein